MLLIPALNEEGYKRGLMATGVPGLVKTTLNIHQTGKIVTTNQNKATIHFKILPTVNRLRSGERVLVAIFLPFL
jgi:hypothetical protein